MDNLDKLIEPALARVEERLLNRLTEQLLDALLSGGEVAARQLEKKLRVGIGNGNNQYRQDNPTKEVPGKWTDATAAETHAVDVYVNGDIGSFYNPKTKEDLEGQERNFMHINANLRGTGAWSGVSDMIKNMESLANKHPLERDTTLYRVVSKPRANSLKEGMIFQDRGFVSTTSSRSATEQIAEDLGYYENDFSTLVISVPKGYPAIETNKLSIHPDYYHQREVILQHGSKFRVTKNAGDKVYLEVVR